METSFGPSLHKTLTLTDAASFLCFFLFFFFLASVHNVLSALTSPPEVTETKREADGQRHK